MLSDLNLRMKEEICQFLFKIRVDKEANVSIENTRKPQKVVEHRGDGSEQKKVVTYKREDKKMGRNDSCHCGSGKKFKKCHGR